MHKLQGSVSRLLIALFLAVAAFGETPISDPVSGRGASWQAAPVSATDGRDFLLVWVDWRSGRPAIYATRVAADGSVLDPDGILVSDAVEQAGAPAVAWTGDSYIVVWQQNGCRFRRITRDGRIEAGTGSVLEGGCWSPRVAALNGTTFVAALHYSGIEVGVIENTGAVRKLDPSIGGPFDIACTRSECRLVWEWSGIVYERRLGGNGERLLSDRILATDASAPVIAATADRFLLAWRDQAGYGMPSRRIWVQELDAASEPSLIAETTKPALVNVGVSPSGRGFMIAWSQERAQAPIEAPIEHGPGLRGEDVAYISPQPQWEIRARRIGDGEEEERIVARSNVSRYQRPSVVSNGSTHFGTWIERTSNKISAAILNDDGAVSRIAVTRTATLQSEPYVLDCGDHLLVTWAEERDPSGRYSILARRFQLSGEALDPRPVVIADSAQSQHRPVAAFDGQSYLVAWYAGFRVQARRIHRDFTLAAEVLDLTEDHSGEPPAVVATDRGFAVLHGLSRQLVLTRIGADSALERTVIAGSHMERNYALGWTGTELVAIWAGYDWASYDNRVFATRTSSGGARLGPDILVDFGVHPRESLSIACDPAQCVAAWGAFNAGIRTATIANGWSFLVGEPILEVPYYRTQSTDRYRPTVMRAAGEFKVITYSSDGTLYMRSVRDSIVSAESAVSEPRVEQEDYAVASTAEGLVTVYSRSVPGPGYGGVRRLFIRRQAQ